ncbi:hypothetical protein RhiirA5_418276 [Rhizophagus irregularis]|uniref:Putative restriction endonuclease domain-containing protein n=5 Tax=Rhizophagus irregularis TaxID=588596 RepID=A0A2N0PKN6_9GLOM|nr:hypothetical protein RirG_150090 [Rhizophagus irregularis DAOM 197198w]PKC07393.1 hypothetical protein RhiirA5_418276 [Rhizophagus irregularis]GBC42257.2 Uma2 family endonuclease [Rhizophagus irregularis DAOM 181602=DAOM 197198]UZO26235.1 hypothetical protein OCT59_018474 [Rhizophagus irregularis]CAB4375710.1 unnamed protein product [Rhizophagus irregularis]
MFPRSLVPKSNIEQFEETSYKNPKSFRMNLIDGQLDILPAVEFETAQRETKMNFRVIEWCNTNSNLVGTFIPSLTCVTLPNGDILNPSIAVVLNARWNALTDVQKYRAYPPVAPNFVVEFRSRIDSPEYFHNKMLRWIDGGVEEGISIDRFVNPLEVRIYSFDSNTNQIVWLTHSNPSQIASKVLDGFVINMEDIL